MYSCLFHFIIWLCVWLWGKSCYARLLRGLRKVTSERSRCSDRFIPVLLTQLFGTVRSVHGEWTLFGQRGAYNIKGFWLDLEGFSALYVVLFLCGPLHSAFLRSGRTSIVCTKSLESRSTVVPVSTSIDNTHANQFKPFWPRYTKIIFVQMISAVILIKIRILPDYSFFVPGPNLLRPLIRQNAALLLLNLLFIS